MSFEFIPGAEIAVRELGAPDGRPVLHFHGTPGSRLEFDWGEADLLRADVRLVTFDRPGYGRSPAAPFSLTSVAKLAVELLDELGIGEFVANGWSGGGPFALATAVVAPTRVRAVGVMSGVAPAQHRPEVLERWSEGNAEAARHLKTDPVTAAELLRRTFEPLGSLTDRESLLAGLDGVLSERDKSVLNRPDIGEAFVANVHEASLQRFAGGGWDSVAWVGDWGFDLSQVRCPVRLWYSDQDAMVSADSGTWLQANLPNATLTLRPGYGHLAPVEHLTEMLEELLSSSDN